MSEVNDSMMKKRLDEEKEQHQSQGGIRMIIKGLRKGKRKTTSFISSTPKSKEKKKTKTLRGTEESDEDEDDHVDIDMGTDEEDSDFETEGSSSSQAMLDLAVRRAITKMLPDIVESIMKTLEGRFTKQIEKQEQEIKGLRKQLAEDRVKNAIYEDRNEQFRRKDCFIVEGVKEEGGETKKDLIEGIQQLGNLIEVDIKDEGIEDVYRIGRQRGQKPRPLVVRTNRLVKARLWQKKRVLNDNQRVKDNVNFSERVVIYEDLTAARRKLFKVVKESSEVDFCYTREGTIVAKRKDGQ